MSKKYISLTIALLLPLAFLMAGCHPDDRPDVVAVTFDAQGGTEGTLNGFSFKMVKVGSIYEYLPVPTKEGFIFKGWYTEPDGGGTKITENTIVTITEDHYIYAHWERGITTKTVTVTFEAQGVIVSPKTKQMKVGYPYGLLPTPTLSNHTFLGWYTTETGILGTKITEDSIVSENRDHTLYARWEIIPSLLGSVVIL